jgi:hypothetical protein
VHYQQDSAIVNPDPDMLVLASPGMVPERAAKPAVTEILQNVREAEIRLLTANVRAVVIMLQ